MLYPLSYGSGFDYWLFAFTYPQLYRKINSMTKKRISIKDKKLKLHLKNGGRKGAGKDFFELLKRAVNTPADKSGKSNLN